MRTSTLLLAFGLSLFVGGCLDGDAPPPAEAALQTAEQALVAADPNACTQDNECVRKECKGSCRVFNRFGKIHPSCHAPQVDGICEPWDAVCSDGLCRRVPAQDEPPSLAAHRAAAPRG